MRPSACLAALALVAPMLLAVPAQAAEDAVRGYAEAFARALATGDASTLRPLRPGAGVEAARAAFRSDVPQLASDRVLAPLLEPASATREGPEFRRRVEARTGVLR